MPDTASIRPRWPGLGPRRIGLRCGSRRRARAAGWLRAEGQPQKEFIVSCVLAVALVLNSVVLAPLGLIAIAIGYATLSSLIMISAALLVLPVETLGRKVPI